MISKDLKKLSRRELVDIIYQMKKKELLMRDEIASLQDELEDRRIRISQAGSIAEAAISVTDVFSAAQEAADLYLQEIARMKKETEKACAGMIEEAKKETEEIIAEREKQCARLDAHYRRECEKWYKLHQEVRMLEKTDDSEADEE